MNEKILFSPRNKLKLLELQIKGFHKYFKTKLNSTISLKIIQDREWSLNEIRKA